MDGAFSWQYGRWESGHSRTIAGSVIDEGLVRIHVNGQELASFMATPIDLDLLVLGFLRSEGIIQGRSGCAACCMCAPAGRAWRCGWPTARPHCPPGRFSPLAAAAV
jgi:formate dehydrogenase assembly factor FdhD